ncbi:MAG: GAF domain-containing protein [Anaerolineaceae bacterium]|nr:GAF domain-containing protein [Anaerolineaceae bacterium]MCB9098193.1 GAF domain-containing protein [Anaerolineales bacterium]
MGTPNLLIGLSMLGSLLYLLLIFSVLQRRGLREHSAGLLVDFVLCSWPWTLGHLALWLDGLPFLPPPLIERLLLYNALLLSIIFFHLTRTFLRRDGYSRRWWITGLVWLLVSILLGEQLLPRPNPIQPESNGALPVDTLTFWFLTIGWAAFMGSALWLSGQTYAQIQQPLHRNRITYWFTVMGLIIADALLFLTGSTTPGGGLHLIGVMIATYVILTHGLPDVRHTARRIISYLIITALTVALYTAGILATQYAFQSVPGYSSWLAGAAIALVLAIIFDPLSKMVQRLVNQFISNPTYDLRRLVQQYSANISNVLDLEQLATMAITFICNELQIRRGAVYVIHHVRRPGQDWPNDYFKLRGIVGTGEGLPPGIELPEGALQPQSPVVENLRDLPSLSQYDIDLLPKFQGTPPEEKAWLANLNMDIYVPIYASGEWIGLLTFGPKRSGDRYFDQDLDLLRTLADQTAVALENARLFDDLKYRNEKIEQLNYELSVANEKLARLDQAKSDFIGVASHELRTPMTQIRGYSDMLLDMLESDSLSPETESMMIRGMSKGVNRLEEIVNKMFEISKIDTETLDLSVEAVSIKEVIDDVVQEFDAALQERRQTLSVDNLATLPTIIADDDRLKQVFMHLVQNAIKYTPDGGRISITGRDLGEAAQRPEDAFVEIVVADTGIGLAPEELEHIFDKFYRVGDARHHSTGQTKFKGAGPGLGLTIARGIVTAHGGRIWGESRGYDEMNLPGSEFHVVLPVASSQLELISSEEFEASL